MTDLTGLTDRGKPASAVARRPGSHEGGWTATSLFSGCGGLDLGFGNEGVEPVVAYDSWRSAVEAFNRNIRDAARLVDLSAGTLLPSVRADILLAGAPCQGFSTKGRRNVDDPRNDLLGRVADFSAAARPRVVVVENVPAALSGGHSRHWLSLEERLRSQGYNVRRLGVMGEDHGVAQRRKRLILLAWIGSDCIDVRLEGRGVVTLRSALARIGNLPGHNPKLLEPESTAARIATRIAQGQKLSNVRLGLRNVATWDIPEVFGATDEQDRSVLRTVTRLRRRYRRRDHGDGDPVERARLRDEVGPDADAAVDRLVANGYLRTIDGMVEFRHTYNGKYRRLEWDGASPTVDTEFANPAHFLHPHEDRGLTLREAMRIQGLPDWFDLQGSRTDAFAMVGNAVPPPMAAAVARFVREAILKA